MFSADLDWMFICLVLFGAILQGHYRLDVTVHFFFSVSRLVSEHFEQWGCVWRGSAVLRWDSEISLRKQCNPQTPAGQELYRCGSEAHPEAAHGRRHRLHYSRTHPSTGVLDLTLLRRVERRFKGYLNVFWINHQIFLFKPIAYVSQLEESTLAHKTISIPSHQFGYVSKKKAILSQHKGTQWYIFFFYVFVGWCRFSPY